MSKKIQKIGLGGGCHWCTEAVFQSLRGVHIVEQGFVASTGKNSTFSEAVIVHFNPEIISQEKLIQVHLYTHKSTSNHSMRSKYRSAVYYFEEHQKSEVNKTLQKLQEFFTDKIITETYPFVEFKPSRQEIQNYYFKDPEKPFCKRYIHPKLKLLREQFSKEVKL